MAKKRHESIRGLSERQATKEYMRTLKDVYTRDGLVVAAGYEIKSTLHSLGKRLANLFDFAINVSYDVPNYSPRSESEEAKYRQKRSDEQWASDRRRENRTAERHGYILRGRKKKDSLENVAPTTAIIAFLGSIFFISPNVTGNVIASLPSTSTNATGIILFLFGIIGAFFCFRKR